MKDNWLYDLTDADKALVSLSRLIGVDENDIGMFLHINTESYLDTKKIYWNIIKEFGIDEDNVRIDDIEIKSIHVTTGNDNGKSIHEHGLLNLRCAIKEDTTMRRFLDEKGIEIDVQNKLINYKGTEIKIEDNSYRYGLERNFVHHKLYKDYLINGFHCDENPTSYGGNVAYRPEFIGSLGKLLENDRLQYDWADTFKQCLIVEFKAEPYKYEWFNYQIDNMSQQDYELDKENCIKKWLIRQAINVICYKILGWGKPEIFSYLGFSENVPSKDIIRVVDVTEERDNLR